MHSGYSQGHLGFHGRSPVEYLQEKVGYQAYLGRAKELHRQRSRKDHLHSVEVGHFVGREKRSQHCSEEGQFQWDWDLAEFSWLKVL